MNTCTRDFFFGYTVMNDIHLDSQMTSERTGVVPMCSIRPTDDL